MSYLFQITTDSGKTYKYTGTVQSLTQHLKLNNLDRGQAQPIQPAPWASEA